jgi:hypothetical protein
MTCGYALETCLGTCHGNLSQPRRDSRAGGRVLSKSMSRHRQTPEKHAEQLAAAARFLGRPVPDAAKLAAAKAAAQRAAAAEEQARAYRARIAAERQVFLDQVPPGHYAVDGPVGLMFVNVSYGDGAAPVIEELKGTPVHHVREMNRATLTQAPAEAVFEAIVHDTPAVAGQRFGRELGYCGRCGALLTNETSRTRGYGPDCYRRA